MSYYDTSYPPSLWGGGGLPPTHDLDLVGVPRVGTLTVDFTWDSDGKKSSLDYGDGTVLTDVVSPKVHTYGTHDIFEVTVTSGEATDSATLDLTATLRETVDDEPEDDESPDQLVDNGSRDEVSD